MGKLKPRIKAGKKKWKKGQSSSSNPSITKYREAAKSSFFTPNLGTSRALTVGALKTHDAFSSTKPLPEPSEPSEAGDSVWSDATTEATTATFKTFASEFSSCSNMSFSKLLNNFQPSSALHKEMLAVLSAIAEIIKDKGGEETSTEYFAALMTALDASESEESTSAIVSLLSMGIKTVPQEVLQLKFSEVSKSLLDVFTKYSDGDNFVIVRCVIGCLSVVLRAQDPAVWSYPSTLQIFQSILVYTIFTKPKVRKAAQHAVVVILKCSSLIPPETTHPAAAATAKFCIQKMEEGASVGGGSTALQLLGLLKEIISTFPKSFIKSGCEAILKLLTLGNVLMTSCCFQTLHGLFSDAPPTTRLTPTLNAQLIHALYDYQPGIMDWQSILAWLTVMQDAYCHLAKIDASLCAENLLKLFTKVTQMWLSDNSKILANATHALRAVSLDAIPLCQQHANFPTIAENIFTVVEEGLKYQYHNAWTHVLNILATLFETLGPSAASFTPRCLVALADLRDSYNFSHTAELEYAVGSAIRSLGPELVLKAIPLNITGRETSYEFKRGWMLPVLKENVQAAPLSYFTKNILPLANICRKRSDELKKAKDNVGGHSYELLCCQLWALFPSFCNNTPDVTESFKALAPILGAVLNDWKILRLSVMSGLRKLIQKGQEQNMEEGLKLIGRFAKNFLPILFNIYTTKAQGTDEEGHRLAALDTIKVYVTVAPKELCCELFDKALTHLDDSDSVMKASVMDLIKTLLAHLDETRLLRVYDLAVDIMKKPQRTHGEEKKAYRLIEYLCACPAETCREFVIKKIPQIRKRMLSSVKRQASRNAGARLRVIRLLIRLLPRDQFAVIKTMVPEAVLRCKDNNTRTRACAFDLLVEMFQISKEWSDKSEDDLIRDYISLILGGVSGSPTLVSATLLGLGRLTYLLKDRLPLDVTQMLISAVCLLLAESSREIVSAGLVFIKTFMAAFRIDQVTPHVPSIVNAILSITEDCKRHSRLKIRDILDRLGRKFGYDTIKDLVPNDDAIMHKRINNLRKLSDRKKKKRLSSEGEEDSDDDDIQFNANSKPRSIEEILASSDESGNEEEVKPRVKDRKAQKSQMFIREEEDDIVDLVSPAAASKLTARKPQTALPGAAKQRKEQPFEVSATGKLIIPRDILDDTKKRKTTDDIVPDDGSDNDLDDVASEFSHVQIGQKRKLSTAGSSKSGFASTKSGVSSKYQAGGSGIHRPLSTHGSLPPKKKPKTSMHDDVKSGKEYRAKKARGDVKIKGKPDPYAYVPLSRKLLNKRKKAKAGGRFNNIVKSAVKGAKIGSKRRKK